MCSENRILKNLETIAELYEGHCKCDPEVGWLCEACFIRNTVNDARMAIEVLRDMVVDLDERIRNRK